MLNKRLWNLEFPSTAVCPSSVENRQHDNKKELSIITQSTWGWAGKPGLDGERMSRETRLCLHLPCELDEMKLNS